MSSKHVRRQTRANTVLLTELKHNKEIYRWWKEGQAIWEEYKDIVHSCRNGVRKAKAQLELMLMKEVKGNGKGFSKYIVMTKKARGSVWQEAW